MTAYCHKIDKYEYRLDNIIGKGYSSIVYKGKNT